MASKILLEPDKYYHIFNHAIGVENLFNQVQDYELFIRKFNQYISPICSILAFCLMPNHFHFCLQLKEERVIIEKSHFKYNQISEMIYRCFSHFFNCYVQCYNKRYIRMGGLFVGNFKRLELETDDVIRRVICYIHNNPVEAKIVPDPGDYKFSSYSSIIENSPPQIPIFNSEIIRLFNDLDNFRYLHNKVL